MDMDMCTFDCYDDVRGHLFGTPYNNKLHDIADLGQYQYCFHNATPNHVRSRR